MHNLLLLHKLHLLVYTNGINISLASTILIIVSFPDLLTILLLIDSLGSYYVRSIDIKGIA
jgi:hypothetical protein